VNGEGGTVVIVDLLSPKDVCGLAEKFAVRLSF